MALLPLEVSGGNECRMIEPDPNPNESRTVFENWIFVEVT
jgi:hypothetical protein